MLTFINFIEPASKKTITFTSAEVSNMREQVGDAIRQMGDLQEDGSMTVSVGDVLEASHALSTPGPTSLIEFSKRSHLIIMLDANLRGLKQGLEHDGFEVLMPLQGVPDETLMQEFKQCAFLTENVRDFREHAVAADFDIISIKNIKFIDTKHDRTDQTVRKISSAIRESNAASRRGNVFLTVHDDGSWKLEDLK